MDEGVRRGIEDEDTRVHCKGLVIEQFLGAALILGIAISFYMYFLTAHHTASTLRRISEHLEISQVQAAYGTFGSYVLVFMSAVVLVSARHKSILGALYLWIVRMRARYAHDVYYVSWALAMATAWTIFATDSYTGIVCIARIASRTNLPTFVLVGIGSSVVTFCALSIAWFLQRR